MVVAYHDINEVVGVFGVAGVHPTLIGIIKDTVPADDWTNIYVPEYNVIDCATGKIYLVGQNDIDRTDSLLKHVDTKVVRKSANQLLKDNRTDKHVAEISEPKNNKVAPVSTSQERLSIEPKHETDETVIDVPLWENQALF